MIQLQDSINGLDSKLSMWKRAIENNYLSNFSNLRSLNKDLTIGKNIIDHLDKIQKQLIYYFPSDLALYSELLINPFNFDPFSMPDDLQENFCDFVNDTLLRNSFDNTNIEVFWSSIPSKYNGIKQYVIKLILPFPTTYLAECSFSSLLFIKNDRRNRTVAKNPVMVALSKIAPRLDKLSKKK